MRPKFLITISIVVLVLIAVLSWHYSNRQATPLKETEAVPASTQQTAMQPTNQSASAIKATSNPAIAVPTAEDIAAISNKAAKAREIEWQRAVAGENVPVNFFGRVIDQDNNPIAGAKIVMGVRHNEYSPLVGVSSSNPKKEILTDADGRFDWTDSKVTGDILGVGSITKDGYEAEPGQYSCGAGGGNYNNPVIFKMWSTNIHEQLITGNKSFEIVPDGRPYFINLMDGTISEHESGDLKVWVQYTNQVVQGQLYDWSAGIEVANGGLWEVPQTAINSGFLEDPPFAMYSAPTDGYIPSFGLKSQIKGGQSGEIGNRYFYLLLKDGKEYGKMSINLFAPYGNLHPGLIRLSYAINPSGSRILR
jgi:hypothetical protein